MSLVHKDKFAVLLVIRMRAYRLRPNRRWIIMKQVIETRLATLERISDELFEIRFKPGMKLDKAGLMEVLNERKRFSGSGAHHVLAVFPAESDFDMEVMTSDHYLATDMRDHTRSLALAANGTMNERMASLYFAYFPQPFEARVFVEESDAREWLMACMASPRLN